MEKIIYDNGVNIFGEIKSKIDVEVGKICQSVFKKTDKADPIWRNSSIDILEGILYTCIQKGTMTDEAFLRYLGMDYKELAYSISYLDGVDDKGTSIRKVYKGAEKAFSILTSTQAGYLYSNFISNMFIFIRGEALVNDVRGDYMDIIVWDNSLSLDEKSKLIKQIKEDRELKGNLATISFNDFVEEDYIVLKEIGFRSRFEGIYLDFDKLNIDKLNVSAIVKSGLKNYIYIDIKRKK